MLLPEKAWNSTSTAEGLPHNRPAIFVIVHSKRPASRAFVINLCLQSHATQPLPSSRHPNSSQCLLCLLLQHTRSTLPLLLQINILFVQLRRMHLLRGFLQPLQHLPLAIVGPWFFVWADHWAELSAWQPHEKASTSVWLGDALPLVGGLVTDLRAGGWLPHGLVVVKAVVQDGGALD